jgi:D-amino-acid dehydrogenase
MQKQVTVIGAGAVGISTALSLLEAGHSVQVLDRNEPASGASHGNAGVVSPWSCVPQSLPGLWKSAPKWLLDPAGPLVVRPNYWFRFLPWALKFLRAGQAERLPAIADAMNALSRSNLDLYRHHLSGTGGEDLIRDSYYVHVYRHASQINMNAIGWQLRSERGVPLEIIAGEDLRALEPALSTDYEAAVVMRGQGRAMDPGKVGRTLADKARGMGAVFRRVGVSKLSPTEDRQWALQTDDGSEVSQTVVVAAGVWSARLLAPLGFKLPLEAERGYHLVLRNPGVQINHSIMDTENKFVASLMAAGVRCAGTAEFAGLEADPDYRRAQMLAGFAKKLFPDINTDDPEEWMGARPSFPDSLPAIGPVPGQQNLYAAFGHCHYGFGMAPSTGRIVAQLVSGLKPNVDLAPYSIERFA